VIQAPAINSDRKANLTMNTEHTDSSIELYLQQIGQEPLLSAEQEVILAKQMGV
jgi:Sigma-70 factor, region 1.2